MRGRKIEARREERPARNARSTSASAFSRSRERGGAGVQRGQRVDQHDLPVEPGEMIAEERPHDMRLIGLVAPLHHRRERAGCDRVAFAERNRREGQRRRALEVARHKEAAGRQGRERVDVVARLPQIGGEQLGDVARRVFVGLGVRVEAAEGRAPIGRERRAGRASRSRPASRAPIRVGLVEERQVEQPFAGIVDEVDARGSTRFEPQPAALSNSIVRRNCEMRRVDCGQRRSGPPRLARCSS